ncbi:LacI family transcriptional regulator [Devosia pacifica]|uniref:LacI family transcriptional regulator n=1 Tax=Devosia pacifica TaxID=1335967 RepID=A0A918S3U2_9HYPH|nr:LacI family DNA-binding transcriptional regulator [Devosia pacifica]GHA21566.1 LacI family transcriptional regulator [Devosia pacifica]
MYQDQQPGDDRHERQPTIVDVANRAGVAIGTVSRHLNGQSVRMSNRDQIERAIAELGYRRNSTAVAMKTDTSHIVGFMVPSLGEFHAGILEQLTRKMRLNGRAVLSFCHDMKPHLVREGLEFFASHRVDAVVMDGEDVVRADLLPYIEKGLVVALYDNDVEGIPVDRVFVDNRRASARAVDHLIDLGHRRVATIRGNERDYAARERLAGFRQACDARGVVVPPEYVVHGNWGEIGGYFGIRALMELAEPPTAIFSANYNMTIGALTWAQENGVVLPRDLSLVSFDDVPAFKLHNPGITAVEQPIERLADTLSSVLDARLADPAVMGRREIKVECNIILRGSTGPVQQ